MSATTVYDVVTRYRSETGRAVQATRRYGDEALRTSRHLGIATAASGSLHASLMRIGATVGGIASLGFAVQRTVTSVFQNLNQEMNTSLSLAAQLNLAFRWDADPGKNFAASLQASKSLLRDIASDAARLPGTAGEYFGIAGMIANTVTSGGGDIAKLREMTSLIGVAAPFAGQSRPDAANQAFRMLLGTASMGDNPLFARMLGGGLFSPGMTTEKFNQLNAGKRLDEVYNALHRIVTPNYLEAIVRTFDTQLGTLTESIVGSTGILSEVAGRDIFESFLDGLVDLNASIDQHRPEIVGFLRTFGSEIGLFAGSLRSAYDAISSIPGMGALGWGFGKLDAAGDLYMRELHAQMRAAPEIVRQGIVPYGAAYWDLIESKRREVDLARGDWGAGGGFRGRGASGSWGDPISPTSQPNAQSKPAIPAAPVVNQAISIHVDLHSDDSPEAIAVKIGKAMEIAERHPKRSARAIAMVPTASVARGAP